LNFLAPLAFLFAAAIPVVVVFYLLKRRRVVRLVPSTLLWQKFLAETQASAPFQKLRHHWLLILQILMLLLVVLALARPYFAGKSKGGGLLVVIMDASASMQCTDAAPSRFEAARSEALKLVDSMHDDDRMLILQAGANTEVKQSPTSEKAALRRALGACTVTDSPTRLVDALKLAESSVRNETGTEIHLFSDGAVPTLVDFENRGLDIVLHKVGERGNNVGVVTLDVRPNPDNPNQRAIFTSVVNQSSNAVQTELELRFNGDIKEVRQLSIKPGETSPQAFVTEQARDGVFMVQVTAKDDLAADNQASIVSLLPQPVKVLLVSKGNRFLEKALRAASGVQLSVSANLTDNAKGFDLVVLDDLMPVVWPAVNLLAIHTANTNWFDSIGKISSPGIVDWKNTHPLLRFASFDNVQIAESMAVKTPPWAVTMVDSQQSPLIIAGELSRQRIVWVGFDTLQSTWPLRISFPIFIANAVDWLNPSAANNSQLTVKTGDTIRLGLPDNVANAQMTLPDGTVKPLPLDANAREIIFGETIRQGLYRLRLGTNETTFAVNLMDAQESNTKPRSELTLGKYERITATTSRRANMEVWRWLAAAGLVVLLFEWWYYHRRTA
jgi:Ca-activated chloride channel family protein